MFSAKNKDYNVTAILLAAGSGKRMGLDTKKQFIDINSKPLIYYALNTISLCKYVNEIIIVTAKEDIIKMQDIVKDFKFDKVSKIVCGGSERMYSVYNGLKEVASDCQYVLIHDGARPLVKLKDIENVIEDGFKYKAATLGVKAKDTIKRTDKENIALETLNRDELYIIQTPQVIEKNLLLEGYDNIKDKLFTDDTGIVENIGAKVKITEGSYTNIKITTIEDLKIMKSFIE